jgi:hypothetical protein
VFEVGFLIAAAYAAARHRRHLSIYGVAWACFVPALLNPTGLGEMLRRALAPHTRRMAVAAAVAVAVGLAAYVQHQPWKVRLPANPGDHDILLYPVGAVHYLRAHDFSGNLVTPFEVGAYVSWELFPRTLVSLDGRYEVAYDPRLLDRHTSFFNADPGWQQLLRDYPADAVLTRTDARIVEPLGRLSGWTSVYRDDVYQVFVRGRPGMPHEDHRGDTLTNVLR